MNAFEKTIEIAGQSYTFKLPSSKDFVNIDLKALELRKGVTEGMGAGYSASQNVATLSVLCKAPDNPKPNFEELPSYVVDYLAQEVATWERSFREQLAGEKSPVNP